MAGHQGWIVEKILCPESAIVAEAEWVELKWWEFNLKFFSKSFAKNERKRGGLCYKFVFSNRVLPEPPRTIDHLSSVQRVWYAYPLY